MLQIIFIIVFGWYVFFESKRQGKPLAHRIKVGIIGLLLLTVGWYVINLL